MRKKLTALLALMALAVALLPACGAQQGTGGATGDATDQAAYTESELALVSSVESAPSTLTVRFYEDAPSVPYIGLAQYMDLVFGDKATVEVENGLATITSTDGGKAIVDDGADTLTSDSWNTFHNYIEPMQKSKIQGFIDFGVPFVRVASLDYEAQSEPVVFDFAKYNINLHVDEGDAYLPLATASDLMSDVGMSNLAYNGQKAALLHGYADQPTALDPTWYAAMINDEARPQDMADFAYNELCFAIDTLYSCSGKGLLDEDIKANGLDATLAKDETTKSIQKLLKSTDKLEYTTGLMAFGFIIYNGHTGMMDAGYSAAVSQNEDLSARMQQLQGEYQQSMLDAGYMQGVMSMSALQAGEAKQQRDAIWSDGETYHEQGDTAVISIDSFMSYDAEGWAKHLAGEGEIPSGKDVPDVVGTLVAGLNRAKENPEIKNVVIDLSTNGGGSNDVCAAALAIVLGEAKVPVRDLKSGQRFTVSYDVDTLFDGSFDTAALAKEYDFNYAVLTSCSSFSCGNMFPSVLHSAGIPVLGETSGGGTDMVCRLVTPEGLCLTMTDGFAEMTDAEGNQIENGTTPDVELVKTNDDGTKSYSDCYDITKLSEAVNSFYTSEEALPDAA